MKIETSRLYDLALDWAAATTLGEGGYWQSQEFLSGFHPSSDWSQGGPIVERECIELRSPSDYRPGGQWEACKFVSECEVFAHFGQTPLEAAMRCYVASKLGDTVEIPEELV